MSSECPSRLPSAVSVCSFGNPGLVSSVWDMKSLTGNLAGLPVIRPDGLVRTQVKSFDVRNLQIAEIIVKIAERATVLRCFPSLGWERHFSTAFQGPGALVCVLSS